MPTLEALRITHAAQAWQQPFFSHVGQVFQGVDFHRWGDLGGWTEAYEVFALVAGTEIVASIGRTRMRLVINGQEVTGWQLGAVSTRASRRGEGLSRRLMEAALADLDHPDQPVILFANPRVLDFYPRFGFRRVEQRLFTAPVEIAPAAVPAARLDMARAEDRARLAAIVARATPVNRGFAARDYFPILLWHLCDRPMRVHHLEPFDAVAVVSEEAGRLTLHELQATRPFPLAEALPSLVTAPLREIAFGFDPGDWWPGAISFGPDPESYLFVRGRPAPGPGPLRFPDLAQT